MSVPVHSARRAAPPLAVPVHSARRAAPLLVSLALAGSLGGLAGCGGSNEPKKVRDALDRFSRATARKDYHAFCGLLSARLISQLTTVGLTCESALAKAFSGVQQPNVRIGLIQIKGSTATAQVHSSAANQAPSDDTLSLVKESGQWRVATLSAPQPQPVPQAAPQHPPPPSPPAGGARAPRK